MNRAVGENGFKQWELAVDSISDLLVLLDSSGKVMRANRAVEHWSLVSVFEVQGMDVHRLLHRDCDDPSCYLLRLHPEKSPTIETELLDPKLGCWIHMALEPFTEGATPYRLLTVRDITEIRERRIQEGRRTRFEALHIVARNLAHEIGNPLAAMQTTTEVLAANIDRFEPAKVNTYLERILEGTQRIQTIVERTIRDQQFTDLAPKVFDLEAFLRRMYRLFQDEVSIRGVHLELKPFSSPELFAFADSTAAEEVLINVLRNALDATSAGGSISLCARSEADQVEILIRDTGRGMSRHQMANIFQPFFTTKAEGAGIGLAYSSYLMRKMGGTIAIDSQVGEGTTVTVQLPEGKPENRGLADESPRPSPHR